jgi:hypothetical protein
MLGAGVFTIVTGILFTRWQAHSTQSWVLLLAGALAVYQLVQAATSCTMRIEYASGALRVWQLGRQREVQLAQLIEARNGYQYAVGGHAKRVLRLTDSVGTRLNIVISYLRASDRAMLSQALQPFLFAPQVKRNFETFLYVAEPSGSRLTVGERARQGLRMLGKTVLYIFVPVAILTVAVVLWAVYTHQPAFR